MYLEQFRDEMSRRMSMVVRRKIGDTDPVRWKLGWIPFLLRAARDFSLDLTQSLMIGDRCSDIAAANAAGIGKMFLITGTEKGKCSGNYASIDMLDEVRI